jgi:hypothetical protein
MSTHMKSILLSIPLLFGCVSGATRAEQLDSVAWELSDGATTMRQIAALYTEARPDLAQRAQRLADDLDVIARLTRQVAEGAAQPRDVIGQIETLLGLLAATAWSDDPEKQVDVQAALIVVQSIVRRVAHTVDPQAAVAQ